MFANVCGTEFLEIQTVTDIKNVENLKIKFWTKKVCFVSAKKMFEEKQEFFFKHSRILKLFSFK